MCNGRFHYFQYSKSEQSSKFSNFKVLPNLKVENTKLCKFWIDIIAQFITLDNPMTLDLENLTFIEDCLNLENNITAGDESLLTSA